jgi:hypothetical protein
MVTWIRPKAEKLAIMVLENFSVMKSSSPSQLKILSSPDWVIIIPINNEINAQIMLRYWKSWSKKTNSLSPKARRVMELAEKVGIWGLLN